MLSCYADVYGIKLDRDHDEEIAVGMVVRTGSNDFPRYEVLAINGDRAWVRNIDKPWEDALTWVSKCRAIR